MRMLYWLSRSPFNRSNRFPGGTLNSSIPRTLLSWSSFLRATPQTDWGQHLRAARDATPSKMFSVAVVRNPRITHHIMTASVIVLNSDNVPSPHRHLREAPPARPEPTPRRSVRPGIRAALHLPRRGASPRRYSVPGAAGRRGRGAAAADHPGGRCGET